MVFEIIGRRCQPRESLFATLRLQTDSEGDGAEGIRSGKCVISRYVIPPFNATALLPSVSTIYSSSTDSNCL